jgi:hypothetical protein
MPSRYLKLRSQRLHPISGNQKVSLNHSINFLAQLTTVSIKMTSKVSSCFLPSNMDKTLLLQDTELCAALGMLPDSGCCVRHPDISILSGNEELVAACKICESELLSGGQCRSLSFTLMQSMASPARFEEPKVTDDGSQEHTEPSLQMDMDSPSTVSLRRPNEEHNAWMEYTYQIILRTTQVQEWTLAEKDKELRKLRSKLASGSLSSSPARTALVGNFDASMSSVLDDKADETPPRLPHRKPSAATNSAIFSQLFTTMEEDSPYEQKLNDAVDALNKRQKQLVSIDFEVDATLGAHTRHVSNLTLDLDDYDQGISVFEDLEIGKNSNRGPSRMNQLLTGSQARVPPTKPMRQASIEQVALPATRGHRQRSSSSFSIVSEMTSHTFLESSLLTSEARSSYTSSVDSKTFRSLIRQESSISPMLSPSESDLSWESSERDSAGSKKSDRCKKKHMALLDTIDMNFVFEPPLSAGDTKLPQPRRMSRYTPRTEKRKNSTT